MVISKDTHQKSLSADRNDLNVLKINLFKIGLSRPYKVWSKTPFFLAKHCV